VKLQKLVQCCLEPDFTKRKSVPELWDEWNSVKVEDTGMYVTYNEFLDKVPERYWAQVTDTLKLFQTQKGRQPLRG